MKRWILFLFVLPVRTASAQIDSGFVLHRGVTATVFWVGEAGNESSSWDEHWQAHFGGIDNPVQRNGFHPAGFTPLENPFYIALPLNELPRNCAIDADQLPPYAEAGTGGVAFFKNRWVRIALGEKVCYAQWEDVGPFEVCDVPYVLGDAPPVNLHNKGAGIDLSPAVRDCLGLQSGDKVNWQFVNEREVPPGPWREVVTHSPARWD